MDTEIIRNLAQARAYHEKAMADLRQLEDEFKKSPQYIFSRNHVDLAADALNDADVAFRQEAVAEFGNTKEKHAVGYDIAVTRSVTIPDEGAAIRWSITNFTPALALKKKVFEDAVKAGSIPAELAFVLDVPTVRIHSDLSEWLKGE